jgi:hypothetical protein
VTRRSRADAQGGVGSRVAIRIGDSPWRESGVGPGPRFPTPHSQLPLSFLSLVLPVFALACGIQSPPQPPRVEQPEAIKDFAVTQLGKKFVLTFTIPALSTDGERLSKPLEVEIFRAISPPVTPPPPSPPGPVAAGQGPGGLPWKTFFEKDLGPAATSGSASLSVALTEEELAQFRNSTWTFYLRTLTRGFRRHPVMSEWSNSVRETLQNVSEPVRMVEVEATEKALILHWMPPTEGIMGGASKAPSGYEVYRSPSGKAGSFALLGETSAASFSDPNFQFAMPYYYFVRAVFKSDSGTAESDNSPIAEITPRDTFPPAAPSNLTAVFAGRSVDLIWSANTEPDLAGYNVERRKIGSEFVKLNPKILGTPLFRDFSVEAGTTYFYRVRALDRAGNVSAPSQEVEVESR